MSRPIAASPSQKVEVLFFAADARSAREGGPQRLLLDEEVREIRERLDRAPYGDRVDVIDRWAVRTFDLLRLMRRVKPHVVHFSGHGEKEDGIAVVGRDGEERFVGAKGLASLFDVQGDSVRLVVLNACFSLPLAKALAERVGCAIGTSSEISDDAAIAFGSTFYYAIACGDSVGTAFKEACAALDLDGIPQEQHPRLVAGKNADPDHLHLLSRDEQRADSPAVPARRGWVFPLIVWMLSLGGLLWRVQSDFKAILLSVVPLAVTFGLMYGARAAGGQVPMRVRAAAIAFAAFWVVSTALIVDSALETARRRYHAGDYAGAFTRFRELAEEGDSEAKGFLGILYMSARGTAEDDSAGFYWLSEAAQDGDARGMYALGIAYEKGEGVKADARQALEWYRRAARKGHPEAMNKVGELYRAGPAGITQDHDSALAWYGRAANEGSVDGMSNLALMHELGLADTPNLDEALRWHRRAAGAGSTRAMVDLGWVHAHGIGVRANPDSAAYWYRQAAEAGDEFGMNNLGVLYATGSPAVPRDCAQARVWIQRAADDGVAQAAENLPRLRGCGS